MQQAKPILGIILLLLLAIFTVQNASVVTISFFFWKFTVSRSLMIFFVLAAGVIIGLILGTYLSSHQRARHQRHPAED